MPGTAPVLYLPHGGGPLPLLGDPAHAELVAFLSGIGPQLPRPDAIVLVSAHWEASVPTLTGSPAPGVMHDYGGFPPAAYAIAYDAPGEPQLAADIQRRLGLAGTTAGVDPDRAFDHGMFVPLTLMFPAADIPCVQLSLVDGLDPETHLSLGEQLGELRGDNVMVIGSGFSFHNMGAFFANDPASARGADAFDEWLVDTTTGTTFSPTQRRARLGDWEAAPEARFCHPREEHLLPLHVCSGAAGHGAAELVFNAPVLGHRVSGLLWAG